MYNVYKLQMHYAYKQQTGISDVTDIDPIMIEGSNLSTISIPSSSFHRTIFHRKQHKTS